MVAVTSGSARITGWGTALPDKVVTNVDLEGTPRHQRRVDHRAHRHPRAARRRHHHRPRHRGRPSAPWRAPASPAPTSTSCCSAPARPTRPCRRRPAPSSRRSASRGGAVDLNAACSGFVYGLVAADGFLRAGHAARAARRLRDDVADRRLGGPLHRHPLRRRRRRRRARAGRRARAASSAGTSARTARCATSSTPTSAAPSRWTAPRCSDGPCGSWSTRPSGPSTRAGSDRRRRAALRPPPGQHRGSSPRPAPSSASPRSAPPTSSPPPATPRPPRSRWRWPTRPTPAGSHPGDLVLLIGFGAGMSWASAVIEWAV